MGMAIGLCLLTLALTDLSASSIGENGVLMRLFRALVVIDDSCLALSVASDKGFNVRILSRVITVIFFGDDGEGF